MFDFVGQEIKIGCLVAIRSYYSETAMAHGKVVEFTPKRVKVICYDGNFSDKKRTLQPSSMIVYKYLQEECNEQ